jgi:hypothetical protein
LPSVLADLAFLQRGTEEPERQEPTTNSQKNKEPEMPSAVAEGIKSPAEDGNDDGESLDGLS